MKNKGPLFSITEITEKITEFCKGADKVQVFARGKISKSVFGETLERCSVETPKMTEKFPDITVIVVDKDKTMIVAGDLNYASYYFWIDIFNHAKTVDSLSELEKFIE